MRINTAAQSYLMRLGGDAPRVGRVPSILFASNPDPAEVCWAARAVVAPTMPEIDRLMPRYAEVVNSLTRRIQEMDRYYKDKEYKRDAFERGRSLHSGFVSDHAEFLKLHDELANSIDALLEKRDDDVVELESVVAGLRYFVLVFLRDSKQLAGELTKNKPDPARVAELGKTARESHREMSVNSTAHPGQVDEAFMYSAFKGRADTFAESLRRLESRRVLERDIGAAINNYNAMIDAANLVQWPR